MAGMGAQTPEKINPMRSLFGVIATGCSISGLGIGMLLMGFHPKIGVGFIVTGFFCLLWELLTCKPLVNKVPEGMLRFLAGMMISAFTLLIVGPDIENTIKRVTTTQTSGGNSHGQSQEGLQTTAQQTAPEKTAGGNDKPVSAKENQQILEKIESDLAELKRIRKAKDNVSRSPSPDPSVQLLTEAQQALDEVNAYADEWVRQVQVLPRETAASNKLVGRDPQSAARYGVFREQTVRDAMRNTYQQTYAEKLKRLRGQLMALVPGISEPSTSYDNPYNGGELNGIYFDFKELVRAYRQKLMSEGKLTAEQQKHQ
jgi:hypothetical protein